MKLTDNITLQAPLYSGGMAEAPQSLLSQIEIIGEDAALKLVKRYGGQRIRLPGLRNATADHELARLIGLKTLHKLIGLDGGRWIYIPKCEKGLRAQRDQQIVTLYSEPYNWSTNRLAEYYHLSYRRIEQILAQTVVDDRQGGLF